MGMPGGRELPPILCAGLLRELDAALVELLRSLSANDWDARTVAGEWRVRDVAAHLLDTQLRKLSMVRDGWLVEKVEIRSAADVGTLVQRLNREGATVFGRLSPGVITAMLEWSGEASADFHEALDPYATAAFAVSWAGESESLNWFDTAREVTERWHHQQQIRLAVDRPGIMARRLYYPVLDCFLRGLRFAWWDVAAAEGAVVRVEVSGAAGGTWFLERGPSRWDLVTDAAQPAARITIPQEIAWRVFTRGIGREQALAESRVEGDAELAARVLDLTSIVV